jgi:hypothetical protein
MQCGNSFLAYSMLCSQCAAAIVLCYDVLAYSQGRNISVHSMHVYGQAQHTHTTVSILPSDSTFFAPLCALQSKCDAQAAKAVQGMGCAQARGLL